MNFFYKIENQFLLLIFISLTSLIIFQETFWEFLEVPIGNKGSEFNDLKMIQLWSRFFENYHDNAYIYTKTETENILNYPKIWIFFAKLIEKKTYFYSFIILNFFIYVSIFYFFIKKFNSYFFLYLFFSGPSLLVLQRGNVDLLIFILLSFVLLVNNLFLKKLIFFISVAIKIFPVFGIQYFFLIKKNFFKTLLLLVALLIYFYLIKDQLIYIFQNTPHTADSTYGTESIIFNLNKHYNIFFNYIYLSSFFILSLIFTYFLFFKKILIKERYSNEDYFLLGSGIFIFTFLINSSHDYRLIFSFFCVPLFLSLKIKYLKYICLISLFFALELSRLIAIFGFIGGVVNIFFKIVIFYLISTVCLDIIFKFFNKLTKEYFNKY